MINANIVPRLLQLLIEEIENEQLLYEIGKWWTLHNAQNSNLFQIQIQTLNSKLLHTKGALLCTLSKGTALHVRYMIDFNAIQILIKKITHPNTSRPIIEICLRTLRSLFQSEYAPINTIYETHFAGVPFIAYLLNMIAKSNDKSNDKSRLHNYSNISTDNWFIQECILNILASSCRTAIQQNILCQYSCISTISDLLLCDSVRVSKAGLNLLAQLCHGNKQVSKIAVDTRSKSLVTNYEVELLELLYNLLDKTETQLYAARCYTNLFRSDVLKLENRRHEEFVHKSLKVLIRLCKKENHPLDRIEAAEILSYLIEQDGNLQKLSAICDHLIASLSDYLTFNLDNLDRDLSNMYLLKEYKKEEVESRMKEAALKCFSSLAAQDEDVRKKIIETESLMLITLNCLSDENPKVKLAALRCLHSLSRSVRQLQTAFTDHLIWVPLRGVLLSTTDDNILSVVSSTLCNLLLEFSPSKPHFLDERVVETLCALTKKEEDGLRLNGIWALMNLTYQAEQRLNLQVLACLGTDQIFNLLKDKNLNVVLKTLGLLRNVLSIDTQIDTVMNTYGNHIMEITMMCLNDELAVECKEQEVREEALCILANIAHGDESKEFIMSNEELLRKLHSFISSEKPEIVKLQIATVLCINNLIWTPGKDSNERKLKLKQLGFAKSLKSLLNTGNSELFDKAKSALTHFNSKDSS